MTVGDFERLASERVVHVLEVLAACHASGKGLTEFLDGFSLDIARRFLSGDAGFEYCDAVMNGLHDATLLTVPGRVASEIAWAVFLAFDAGEFHSPADAPEIDAIEKYTRPQLAAILAEYEGKSA